MSSNHPLSIRDIFTTAWSKVYGAKASIWGGLIIISAIMLLLNYIEHGIEGKINQGTFASLGTLIMIGLIVQLIQFLFHTGMIYMGIQRSQNLPISYRMVFRAFQSFELELKLIVLYLLQFFVVLIPIALMVYSYIMLDDNENSTNPFIWWMIFTVGLIALIYLSVSMFLSIGIVIDKGQGPWSAIIQSFRLVKPHFWRIIGLLIAELLILAISAIPLGLGLIWTLPLVFIVYGEVYKRLFLGIKQ